MGGNIFHIFWALNILEWKKKNEKNPLFFDTKNLLWKNFLIRNHLRFFVWVGHENINASTRNKHFFTKSCNHQTYQIMNNLFNHLKILIFKVIFQCQFNCECQFYEFAYFCKGSKSCDYCLITQDSQSESLESVKFIEKSNLCLVSLVETRLILQK